MRPKGTNNKIFYNVRLDAEPLRQMKIIGAVDGQPTSQLIRDAIRRYVIEWHAKKKESIVKRKKDFKDIQHELNGWTGPGGERWLESDEVWL